MIRFRVLRLKEGESSAGPQPNVTEQWKYGVQHLRSGMVGCGMRDAGCSDVHSRFPIIVISSSSSSSVDHAYLLFIHNHGVRVWGTGAEWGSSGYLGTLLENGDTPPLSTVWSRITYYYFYPRAAVFVVVVGVCSEYPERMIIIIFILCKNNINA